MNEDHHRRTIALSIVCSPIIFQESDAVQRVNSLHRRPPTSNGAPLTRVCPPRYPHRAATLTCDVTEGIPPTLLITICTNVQSIFPKKFRAIQIVYFQLKTLKYLKECSTIQLMCTRYVGV